MPKEITEDIAELLDALCGVIEQYMPQRELDDTDTTIVFDHQCMSSGEDAVEQLMKYGLADDNGYSIVPNKKFYDIMDEHSEFRMGIKNKAGQ